jgi:predicted peptidase
MKTLKYTTVTEGYDWGPAITKVIINLEDNIDASTLTTSTFRINSVREFYEVEFPSMKRKEKSTVQILERTIIDAYVSDKEGKAVEKGSYATLEMEVGPELTAGSPFYYDLSTGHNEYAKTEYILSLSEQNALQTEEGKPFLLETEQQLSFHGNRNLIAEEFDCTGSYTQDGIELTYASYIPSQASEKPGSNPLIIWLHGAGEGGTDPVVVLYGNKVVNLAETEIQTCFGSRGAYVLTPQCKTMWMDYDGTGTYNISIEGSDGKSYYTKALMGLISNYVDNHPEIDRNRIYLGGCSNGGYMTMNMIINYPDYFAAAYPICEAYSNAWLSEERRKAIQNIPIWFTHAKTDGTVAICQGNFDMATHTYQFTLDEQGKPIELPEFSNGAYHRLEEAGAKEVHYSLWDKVEDTSGLYWKTGSTKEPYEYNGHFSWIYVLNNECIDDICGKKITIFEWLAEQKR